MIWLQRYEKYMTRTKCYKTLHNTSIRAKHLVHKNTTAIANTIAAMLLVFGGYGLFYPEEVGEGSYLCLVGVDALL